MVILNSRIKISDGRTSNGPQTSSSHHTRNNGHTSVQVEMPIKIHREVWSRADPEDPNTIKLGDMSSPVSYPVLVFYVCIRWRKTDRALSPGRLGVIRILTSLGLMWYEEAPLFICVSGVGDLGFGCIFIDTSVVYYTLVLERVEQE